MKRPDIAIKCLEIGEIHGHDVSFMREAAAWINHLESQLQPRKTVDAHDCVLSGNKVVGINESPEAEVEWRKGEEWTHRSEGGRLCKVMYEDKETQLVYFDDGSKSCYWDAKHFAVKRKPSISNAEVEAVKAFFHWAENRPCAVLRVEDYLEQFDVV